MTAEPPPKMVAILGAFDDPCSRHVRLFEEAARLGQVTVLLWPDETIRAHAGKNPKFSLAERLYFLRALRFVTQVIPLSGPVSPDSLPAIANFRPSAWADEETSASDLRRKFCRDHGLQYQVFSPQELGGFPEQPSQPTRADRKKVIVTGCYDWLHSGHVRFFEEVSSYGDLYVIVGHDANIRLLKGEGHPMLSQEERRYMAGSIRYVTQALVSSGEGWLDADPEIRKLKPDIYAVNEDGDRGGKREYCAKMGIEYLVLKRIPAPGLPQRSSTDLRGF
jgi:cytidyltransferase-like protein